MSFPELQWNNFVPRWYQRESVTSAYNYLDKQTGNPLIVLPTGTGKSWIPAMMMHEILSSYPGMRIMLGTHVKELIEQDLEKLHHIWPLAPVGVYSSGLKRKEAGFPLTFGGVQSMVRNVEAFGTIHLFIVDEAHLISPKAATQYQKLIAELRKVNPRMRVVGLTATYYRMGDGLLTDEGQIFNDICYNQCTIDGFNRFIEEGYVVPLVPKKTDLEYDLEGVGVRMGDYAKGQLEERVNDYDLNHKIVNDIMHSSKGRRKWLTFCTSIEHAESIAQVMSDRGKPTRALHSKLSNQERTTLLRDYKSGVLGSLTNKDMLTTGHDFPDLSLMNILRPTASAALWVQMLGRGTRPYFPKGTDIHSIEGRLAGIANSEKQDCLVLDYAGNTARLGPINDPVIPIRVGKKKVKRKPPVKVCPACSNYCHAAVRECECGHVFEFVAAEDKLHSDASNAELVRKSSMPVTDVFSVDYVKYERYTPRSKNGEDCMRVTYVCGIREFHEFKNFEHSQAWRRSEAYKWWEARNASGGEVPKGLDEAIERANNQEVYMPDTMVVWTNHKSGYPKIMSYDFTSRKRSPDPAVVEHLGTIGLL